MSDEITVTMYNDPSAKKGKTIPYGELLFMLGFDA